MSRESDDWMRDVAQGKFATAKPEPTPETDAIFGLIALSNHPECDFIHHEGFLQEARTKVESVERRLAEANRHIAELQKLLHTAKERIAELEGDRK